MVTADLFNAALQHHQAGKLAEAMVGYRRVLAIEAAHVDALHLLGVALHQSGQPSEAVVLIARGLEAARADAGGEGAQHAALYCNLGNALQASGQGDAAIESYRRGIELAPNIAELRSNLGNALHAQGNLTAAIESHRAALAIQPDYPECQFNLGNVLAESGQPHAAIDCYRFALKLRPNYAEALNNLGNGLLSVGDVDEALQTLRRAHAVAPWSIDIRINFASALSAAGQVDAAIAGYRQIIADHPNEAGAHYNLGNALFACGEIDDAAASYSNAIAARPDYAEARYNLAKIWQAKGDWQRAEDGYRSALGFRPDLNEAIFNLGNLLLDRQRFAEAAAQFKRLLAVDAENSQAHCALGNALRGLEQLDEAVVSFRRAFALDPGFAEAHYNLAHVFADAGHSAEAVAEFEAAIALKPDYPEAHRSLGNLLQGLGRADAATACFVQSLRLQPLIARRCPGGSPAFSTLLLLAPGRGNTPIDYLVEAAPFDSHILLFLPGHDYDLTAIADRSDVVLNLISDVDLSGDLLAEASAFLDRLGKPVLNHPEKIRPTDRFSVARSLQPLPGCLVPAIARLSRAALDTTAACRRIALEPPLLLRPAGTHGGEDFELVTDPAQIAPLVAASKHQDFYVSRFADYRSRDGFFRKYRLIFVDGEVFPYHLAIADDWKVHYYRTEMVRREWMRREEARFLNDPAAVFEPAQLDALRAIQSTIDLDFFGIDCGLDRDGRLVVFEVNATMLVHAPEPEPVFAYKQDPVMRIKQAFGAMLARAAGRALVRA